MRRTSSSLLLALPPARCPCLILCVFRRNMPDPFHAGVVARWRSGRSVQTSIARALLADAFSGCCSQHTRSARGISFMAGHEARSSLSNMVVILTIEPRPPADPSLDVAATAVLSEAGQGFAGLQVAEVVERFSSWHDVSPPGRCRFLSNSPLAPAFAAATARKV